MPLNKKVSIVLADDKKFGIGVIDGIITSESFNEGKREMSVTPIYPLKAPPSYFPQDTKQEVEFSRYKQDCRKRALDLAHSECVPNARSLSGGEVDVLKTADKYYNWLISIPQ